MRFTIKVADARDVICLYGFGNSLDVSRKSALSETAPIWDAAKIFTSPEN